MRPGMLCLFWDCIGPRLRSKERKPTAVREGCGAQYGPRNMFLTGSFHDHVNPRLKNWNTIVPDNYFLVQEHWIWDNRDYQLRTVILDGKQHKARNISNPPRDGWARLHACLHMDETRQLRWHSNRGTLSPIYTSIQDHSLFNRSPTWNFSHSMVKFMKLHSCRGPQKSRQYLLAKNKSSILENKNHEFQDQISNHRVLKAKWGIRLRASTLTVSRNNFKR